MLVRNSVSRLEPLEANGSNDERYMPREVADALKKQGVWREGAEVASMGKSSMGK